MPVSMESSLAERLRSRGYERTGETLNNLGGALVVRLDCRQMSCAARKFRRVVAWMF